MFFQARRIYFFECSLTRYLKASLATRMSNKSDISFSHFVLYFGWAENAEEKKKKRKDFFTSFFVSGREIVSLIELYVFPYDVGETIKC